MNKDSGLAPSPASSAVPALLKLGARLATVPEVSIAKALQSVRGDPALLERMLELFIAHHGDAAMRAKQLLQCNERDAARVVIHSLKSSSGSLGASHLFCQANKIELRLKGADLVNSILPDIDELELSLKLMRTALGSPTVDEPAKAENHGEVPTPPLGKVVLDELNQLLLINDSRALHWAKRHGEHMVAWKGERGAQLLQLIKSFNFKAASRVLTEIESESSFELAKEEV